MMKEGECECLETCKGLLTGGGAGEGGWLRTLLRVVAGVTWPRAMFLPIAKWEHKIHSESATPRSRYSISRLGL